MPSVYPVDPSDIEVFTVVANPIRSFNSSSLVGATGSVYLYPRRSPFQKDTKPMSSWVTSVHDDADISAVLRQVQQVGRSIRNGGANPITASYNQMLQQYMNAVHAQPQSLRLQQNFSPVRFSPSPVLNSNTLRKQIIHDQLNTFYRPSYPTAHWAYSNYNTLNFFTSSMTPADSVIMYPNINGKTGGLEFNTGHVGGTYTPSGAFSFDFYINPRYQQDQANGDFKAGTILHLSSTYALSLVSGSLKDPNGRAAAFRLQLQLTSSADISPSWIFQDSTGGIHVQGPSGSWTHSNPGAIPTSSYVFLSNDNVLLQNHWHHVVVRWGTNSLNLGSGTFNVDGVDVGSFVVPLPTITPLSYSGASPQAAPAVLCMGNFYEGPNTAANQQASFFATDPATRDGLNALQVGTGVDGPASYAFAHPLNAELHDIAIRRCYMSNEDIAFSASKGPPSLDNTFALYVPPFFVEKSPFRQFVGDHGGIFITPFEEVNGDTTWPFSTALSFGVAGHYINLENFVRDFASNNFPRLYHLTGNVIQTTTTALTCNQFLYSQPYVAKRNLTILPCDDGNFVPAFQLLASQSLKHATDDLGVQELSFISIDDMVMTSTLLFGAGTFDDGTQPDSTVNAFANLQLGAVPETPFASAGPAILNFVNTALSGSDVEAGAPLTVFQRTQDPSSNEVVIFDISNIFYGFRIMPQSLQFNEPDLLFSSLVSSNVLSNTSSFIGPVHVGLADDGRGNVYRADCLTPQATWNSVGNVYYDEGLVLIKSPHLYFYGYNTYSMNLRGEQHVHVMHVRAIAPNNQLNSSSNPSYQALPPTGYPNEPDDSFVYISGVNFHDSDMNVVMKTVLAQPLLKRQGDRVLIKTRYDL